MEVIQKDIHYGRSDQFFIYPFFDAHLGSPGCAESLLSHKVHECAALGRHGIAIGGGDWLDCITKNDKRFTGNCLADWVERSNIVESQRLRAKQIFSPVTEQGQWLGIGTGNHEEEIHDQHCNDVIRNLCDDMKADYAGYQTFYVLNFRRCNKLTHRFVIHSWHGSGAAQSEGARLMRLVRLVNEIEADLYLMGHLHAKTTHVSDRLTVWNGKIRSVEVKATICGSWLKAYDQPGEGVKADPSYVEKKGYKPAVIGMPIIRITPDNYASATEPHFEIIS